jgi:hypothetical protein
MRDKKMIGFGMAAVALVVAVVVVVAVCVNKWNQGRCSVQSAAKRSRRLHRPTRRGLRNDLCRISNRRATAQRACVRPERDGVRSGCPGLSNSQAEEMTEARSKPSSVGRFCRRCGWTDR